MRPIRATYRLVACPLAKGTLATWSLDSIFDYFIVQFYCSMSFHRLFWGISRVSTVRDLVRESSRNLPEEFEGPRSVAPLSYAIAGSVLNPNGNYLLHSGMCVVIACVCHCLCLSLLPYLRLLVLQECLRNNTVNASATACNTLLRKDRVQKCVADLRI